MLMLVTVNQAEDDWRARGGDKDRSDPNGLGYNDRYRLPGSGFSIKAEAGREVESVDRAAFIIEEGVHSLVLDGA